MFNEDFKKLCKIFFNSFLYLKFLHIFAPQLSGTIAQLVEQRTENPCVRGSIPRGTTKRARNESGSLPPPSTSCIRLLEDLWFTSKSRQNFL